MSTFDFPYPLNDDVYYDFTSSYRVTVLQNTIIAFNHFSHDGKYITAGSENQCVFLWRTHYEPNNLSVTRKDRNNYYEAIKGTEWRFFFYFRPLTEYFTKKYNYMYTLDFTDVDYPCLSKIKHDL